MGIMINVRMFAVRKLTPFVNFQLDSDQPRINMQGNNSLQGAHNLTFHFLQLIMYSISV